MGGWGDVIGGPTVWARDLGLAVAIGVAMAFVGPFGSYGDPLELRIIRSVSLGFAGSIVLWPTVRLIRELGRRLDLSPLFVVPGALVIGAVPVSATSLLVAGLLSPGDPRTPLAPLYFAVLALVLPMGLVMLYVEHLLAQRGAPSGTPAPEAPPRIVARLPGRLGQEVLALQAEDHYVRIHTPLGSELVLMRLADAIAEAHGIEGLRVHRSWWVAKAAVAAGRTEGRRAVLTLTNGLEVPVTRETIPEARRAGLL